MNPLINLIRINQWYKNLVVFVAILFAGGILNLGLWFNSLITFVALCCVSSVNYIINDILDIEKDKVHPEKCNRPLASGIVSIKEALMLGTVLFLLAICMSLMVNWYVLICILMLFIFTLFYSVWLKNIAFVDINLIAINFVIRASVGAVAINASISNWLIVCSYLLAMLLACAKRKADLIYLGKNAIKHKVAFKVYSKKLLENCIGIFSGILLIAYYIYCLTNENVMLIASIPLATFLVLRYLYLIESKKEIGRKPELILKDKQMMAGASVWLAIVLLSIPQIF